MPDFRPKNFPEIEIDYNYIPGQKQTFEDPGFEPEIEFEEIKIAGQPVGDELYHHFVSTFGNAWEREILNGRVTA